MASVYRLWASLRIRNIMHWQEKWADTALPGYRPGDELRMFGWMFRCLWNLHLSMLLIWLACRPTE